jgi:putative endopeptidase
MKISPSSPKRWQDKKEPEARWKKCSSMTDGALGEAVGQDWVKQNFPPAAKDSMDQTRRRP